MNKYHRMDAVNEGVSKVAEGAVEYKRMTGRGTVMVLVTEPSDDAPVVLVNGRPIPATTSSDILLALAMIYLIRDEKNTAHVLRAAATRLLEEPATVEAPQNAMLMYEVAAHTEIEIVEIENRRMFSFSSGFPFPILYSETLPEDGTTAKILRKGEVIDTLRIWLAHHIETSCWRGSKFAPLGTCRLETSDFEVGDKIILTVKKAIDLFGFQKFNLQQNS